MGKRADGGWRLIAFLYAWTIGGFIAGMVMLLGTILGLLDAILQLITGWEIISQSGMTFSAVSGTVQWWADLNTYAFTGGGDMTWIPST